jgi:hypothetical protein
MDAMHDARWPIGSISREQGCMPAAGRSPCLRHLLIRLWLVIGLASVIGPSHADHWSPSWYPTYGWNTVPYGPYDIHTPAQALEETQSVNDRGFGAGNFSCDKIVSTIGYYGDYIDGLYTVICRAVSNYAKSISPRGFVSYGYGVANPFKNNKCPKPCTQMAGNPVNAGTGNKYQQEQDYRNAGGTLEFTRHYTAPPPPSMS